MRPRVRRTLNSVDERQPISASAVYLSRSLRNLSRSRLPIMEPLSPSGQGLSLRRDSRSNAVRAPGVSRVRACSTARLTRSGLLLPLNRIAQLLHQTVDIPQHPSLDNPALNDAKYRHPRVAHLPAR